jgi:mannosyl-3-phosphoglycerate phosphatase
MSRMVLFTDLDGSLLDGETYRWEPADELVKEIIQRGIPIVFCSSKTLTEQQYYQRELGVEDPMIVENGAALVLPRSRFPTPPRGATAWKGGWIVEFGVRIEKIREELDQIQRDLGFPLPGLSTLPEEEVRHWTGLEGIAVRRAQERMYSETIVTPLSATEVDQLVERLAGTGLAVVRGTRFHTITSESCDKGKAVEFVTALYRECWGSIWTVGIGDGRNDLPMLTTVDHGILLQARPEDWMPADVVALHPFPGQGPVAWCRAIHPLLSGQVIPL